MSIWTLKVAGVEKPLSDWLISDEFTYTQVNRGKSSCTFQTVERFDAAAGPQFQFDQQGELWLRDSYAGGVGAGGSRLFQGYFDSPKHKFSSGKEYVSYQLHDVWWRFERQQFKQHRNQFAGFTGGDPTQPPLYTDIVLPEVYLGQDKQEVWVTNGDTIREVIGWMNRVYNPSGVAANNIVNAGVIENKVFVPIQRAGNIFCNQACFDPVRYQPDTVFIVDSTQDIPVLNVRTLGRWNYGVNPPVFLDYENLPEITISLTQEQQESIERQQQDMRMLNGVLIHYMKTSVLAGVVFRDMSVDKFPLAIDDFTPETSAHYVELAGASLVLLTADVTTTTVADAIDASNATRVAWWLKHDKTLSSNRVDPASIAVTPATFEDLDGNPVDPIGSGQQYELFGALPNWTAEGSTRVVARTRASYKHFAEDGKVIPDHVADQRELTRELVITSATTRPYSAVGSSDSGEFAPVGVAEAVYRAVAMAQQQGSVSISDYPPRLDITIGCRLKLVGPSHTWTNVFPQQISMQPAKGSLTIDFGPAAAIDADKLLELARATRWRTTYNMPSGRATGSVQGSSEVDASAKSHEGNTAHGVGGNHMVGVTRVSA